MGVANAGKKCLYSLDGLSIDDVATIIRHRHAEVEHDRPPCVDFDGNLWGCKWSSKEAGSVPVIMNFVAEFVKRGIDVKVIADGKSRLHSKRASTQRASTREKARIEAFLARTEMQSIAQEQQSAALTQQQREDGKKKLLDLEAKVKSKERLCRQLLDDEFVTQLSDAVRKVVDSTSSDQDGNVEFIEAVLQADPVLISRSVKGNSDMIVSSDSDYSVMVGEKALQLCAVKYSSRKSEFTELKLASSSRGPIAAAVDVLKLSSTRVKAPDCPLFEGEVLEMRMLLAIALGCDVHPGGVKSLGPSKVREKLAKLSSVPADRVEQFREWISKLGSMPTDVIDTFAKALMYEPTNTLVGGNTVFCYMFDEPTVLPKYLREFAVEGKTQIVAGPPMHQCVGPYGGTDGYGSHSFLASEGFRKCITCDSILCRFCVYESNGSTHCHDCFLDGCSDTLGMNDADVKNSISVGDMYEAIRKDGLDLQQKGIAAAEIQDIYDAIVVKKQLSLFSTVHETVQFPKMATENLWSGSGIREISRFEFKDGGTFLREERLTLDLVAGLVCLLAEFVNHEPKPVAVSPKKKMHKVHHIVPPIIRKFAEGSRLDSGERLSKRAFRHAVDAQTPSLLVAEGSTIECNGEIGLQIRDKVRASMRDKSYSVEEAFTSSYLLASHCTCQSGGNKEDDRVACVHNPTTQLKLTMLLHDGLAEHVLFELAAMWKSDPNIECTKLKGGLRGAILALMYVSGYDTLALENASKHDISRMLDKFVVGTEKPKLAPKPQALRMLGPIRNFTLSSPVEDVAKVIDQKRVARTTRAQSDSVVIDVSDLEQPSSTDMPGDSDHAESLAVASNTSRPRDSIHSAASKEETTSETPPEPCYLAVKVLIDAIKPAVQIIRSDLSRSKDSRLFGKKDTSEFAGHRLLCMRAGCATQQPKGSMMRGVIANWTSAFDETKRRSHPNKKRKANHDLENMTPSTTEDSVLTSQSESNRKKTMKTTRVTRRCCFRGCDKTNLDGVDFHRVPPIPMLVKTSISSQITYAKKKFKRSEVLRRLGVPKERYNSKALRYCGMHKMETASFTIPIKLTDVDGNYAKTEYKKLSLEIPIPTGKKGFLTTPQTLSKKVGRDRRVLYDVTTLTNQLKEDGPVSAAAAERLSNLQTCEMIEVGDDINKLNNMNESTRAAVGLAVHVNTVTPGKRTRIVPESTGKSSSPLTFDREPSVELKDLTAKEVKCRTGFEDITHLLAFVSVICDGDIEKVKRRSSMTWLEEWLLYFELVWGKTLVRYEDAEKAFGINNHRIREVFVEKLQNVKRTRAIWPIYASQQEDITLRDDKWNDRYGERRVVFWDNTDISMPKPSNPGLQRMTFLSYYGGNVAKGGISLQLCGWIGVWDLWTGAVSDTDYLNQSGILSDQKSFAEMDLIDGNVVPFTNVVDKGYRSVLAAWRMGKQFVLQPSFAKSDRKFKSKETLLSAAIAADRSANERAVRVCKMSGMLKRGFLPTSDTATMADVWLAWSFQANFVCKPVL